MLFRVLRQSKKANFDASHELEELLLEDNPLKARQRKVQDINNLSAEMRQMEEQSVDFDSVIATTVLHYFLDLPRMTSSRCNAGRTILKTNSSSQPSLLALPRGR